MQTDFLDSFDEVVKQRDEYRAALDYVIMHMHSVDLSRIRWNGQSWEVYMGGHLGHRDLVQVAREWQKKQVRQAGEGEGHEQKA